MTVENHAFQTLDGDQRREAINTRQRFDLFRDAKARADGYLTRHQNRIEVYGLYWHFIDLVWILAFPILYVVNR